MKKLFIIICLLPMAGFGQNNIIFKDIRLPKLTVDSTTKLRTLRVDAAVPDAKKEKLGVALNKWFVLNYTATTTTGSLADTNAKTINGEGRFSGTWAPARANHDMNSTDRVATKEPPVEYKVYFNIAVIAANEKYTIILNDLILEFFNKSTSFEEFYYGNFPSLSIPAENRGIDIGEMYVRMFQDIDTSLQGIGKSAAKYIAKARKKGEL